MCFSWEALKDILIWIIVIGAIFAIIKLLLPMVAANLGGPGSIMVQIITIVLWAALAIIVVLFAFQMISCLLHGGISLPKIGR